MKDFAGNELEVGQSVICLSAGPNTRWMIWGEVIGFTAQKVRIRHSETSKRVDYGTGKITEHTNVTEFLRDPSGVVLPMTPELQDYLGADWLRANLTN